MLKFMREKFQYSLALKIILIAVAASFVGWGIGSGGRRGSRSDVIAEVMDQKITFQEFDRYYQSIVENYRRQLGDRFSPELLEQMDVKNGAFSSLARQKLQLALALQKGIAISDKELSRSIRSNTAFQRDGFFDQQLYVNILRSNRLEPQQYEQSVREEMIVGRLRSLVTDSTKVSQAEVRQAYTRDNEQVKVDFIAFESYKYRARIKPTPEEMLKFYEENMESFSKPPSLKMKYVKFAAADYLETVKVADEKVRTYYEENSREFWQEEKVKVRHILLKVDPGSSDKDWEKARVQAEDIIKKIAGGADFAKLAGEFSQDPGSKGKGGDLGFFPRGQMVKPFEEAAFALKPGELSEPVKSDFGYHVIKVEERQEEGQDPLDTVKDKIIEKLKKTEAVNIAEETAYNISYDITADNFDKTAADYDHKTQVTDWVFEGRFIAGIPGSRELAQAAFGLDVGEVSNALEAAGSYYIFTVLEKRDSYIPELTEMEKQVSSRVVGKMSHEQAEKDAEEAFTKLKVGKTLKELAEEYKLEVKDTDYFTRTGSPKGVGRITQFIQESFKLRTGGHSKVDAGSRFYLTTVTDRKGIGEGEYQREKGDFAKELLEKKRDLMYRIWLTRSMERVNINIRGDFNL